MHLADHTTQGGCLKHVFADADLAMAVLEGMADTPMAQELKKEFLAGKSQIPRSTPDDTPLLAASMASSKSCARTIIDTPTPIGTSARGTLKIRKGDRDRITQELKETIRSLRMLDALSLEATTTQKDTVADTAPSPRSPSSKRNAEDTPVSHADIYRLEQDLRETNKVLKYTKEQAHGAMTKVNTLTAENEALRVVVFDLAQALHAIKLRVVEHNSVYTELSAKVKKWETEEYPTRTSGHTDTSSNY